MEYSSTSHQTQADSVLGRARVLILTDDADASRAWTFVLGRYDIEAKVISYDGLATASTKIGSFHEILVDHYDDPDSALQICRRLRDMTQQPLLLFTYETDERFHLEAYRLGVEECVAKPIGIPLFVAKTRAWLRQVSQQEEPKRTLAANGFVLDPESRVLEGADASVKLSNLECRLMAVFMANRGQVIESGLLTRRVWSMYGDPDPKMLKNLVYRLRHKISRVADGHECIESIDGIGYIFRHD